VELRKKKEEAEDATLAKSRFLAAASHDLRQPTHALGMFVARLAQLPHDVQTGKLIGNLEASVQAMQALLNGLLDVSRLNAQAVQVQAQPIALEDLFDQLRSGLGMIATDKGVRLKIRPTTVWVMSDPTLLYRILLNLVSNALRYTHKGGVLVACRVRADAAIARVEVWDSGMGIAPEHHELIFKEFFQVENPERDRRKGLGLGLNIVHRTAVLLGHRLQFKSSLGHGTRFSVDIALAPEGANGRKIALPAPGQNDELSGLRILVIEDDALSREALVTLLESWAATVSKVENLPAALALLKTGSIPDVILSDYRLPDGVNGMGAIAQIRTEVGSDIPACLISGDTDPELMLAARDAGLTLLHKPVRPAKLRSFLRRLVVRRQVEDADVV
jgi:CheY-like chemotaxis protein/two-component sensor histidine kinase